MSSISERIAKTISCEVDGWINGNTGPMDEAMQIYLTLDQKTEIEGICRRKFPQTKAIVYDAVMSMLSKKS